MIDGGGIPCGFVFRCKSLELTNAKSTLVQVMAWCRPATSHYLSQCWPASMSTYGVTRPQWVNWQNMLTHWGGTSLYGAATPGQPSLAATPARSAYLASAATWWQKHCPELHTATYLQISYIPICWHRRNRYCFHFIIQSKLSLHRLSVETRNTDLTWPGQSCIH